MNLFNIPSRMMKANPYHDERGRFTSGPGGSSLSSKQPKTKKPKLTITVQRLAEAHHRRQRDAELHSYAAAFKHFLSGGSADYGSSLHQSLQTARLSKDEWHQLARLIGDLPPSSWSGRRVKSKILGRIHNLLVFDMKTQSRAGRSAA